MFFQSPGLRETPRLPFTRVEEYRLDRLIELRALIESLRTEHSPPRAAAPPDWQRILRS